MNSISYSQNLVSPVTLISISDGDRENIATMSWVCALSRKPPLLMVSISPLRYSHDLVLSAGEFAILVLSDTQEKISTLAATSTIYETWNHLHLAGIWT